LRGFVHDLRVIASLVDFTLFDICCPRKDREF
jgi:hypothetical protein